MMKNGSLYDMQADPGQTENIAAQRPEVAKKLKAAYRQWRTSLPQPRTVPPPIPVGCADWPTAILRTHLARVSSVERVTRWTNGFVANWTSTDGVVEWDIDVVAGGTFDVAIRYTCAKENLGAKVLVEAASGGSVAGAIDRAADPTPVPVHDRVPATEAPPIAGAN